MENPGDDAHSSYLKEVKAKDGLRRNSYIPDLFEGNLGLNLRFKRKFGLIDYKNSSDNINTMISQIRMKKSHKNESLKRRYKDNYSADVHSNLFSFR